MITSECEALYIKLFAVWKVFLRPKTREGSGAGRMFANEAHFCLECYTSYRISPLKVPIVEAEETMAMYALHSIRGILGR